MIKDLGLNWSREGNLKLRVFNNKILILILGIKILGFELEEVNWDFSNKLRLLMGVIEIIS